MKPAKAVLLILEKRPMEGRTHSPVPGTSIGRADCDILLPDPDVSRRHAVIAEVDGALAVEDEGSKNGTFVNGQRIDRVTVLRTGDEVRFGNTVWHVESAPAAVEETRVATVPPAGLQETSLASAPPAPEPVQDTVLATSALESAAQPPQVQPVSDTPAAPVSAAPVPAAVSRAAEPAAAPPPFSPPSTRRTRGSAARRLEATLVAYAVILATAIAVTVYFIQR